MRGHQSDLLGSRDSLWDYRGDLRYGHELKRTRFNSRGYPTKTKSPRARPQHAASTHGDLPTGDASHAARIQFVLRRVNPLMQ